MNTKMLKGSAIAVVSVAIIGAVFTAYSQLATNVPPDLSADQLQALVIEDFESGSEWTITSEPKKFNASQQGRQNVDKKEPVIYLEAKVIDGSPSDLKVEEWSQTEKGKEKTKVLGVNFEFRYSGYNSVHITPPKPIKLPGRARALSIWAHGRGNNYSLEAWVKDYTGAVHILKFGPMDFVGWKPLKVDIPVFIPQSMESYPQTKQITIERFVIRADPRETVRNTYFFFDQLKVLTETYEVNFDGQKLEESFQSYQDERQSEGNTSSGTSGSGAGAGQ